MHGRLGMRALIGLLLLSPVAVRGDPVEVELAAGGAYHPEGPTAPVVSGRIGIDFWDFFSPGIRATAVLGGEGVGDTVDNSPDSSGNRAWSVLAELRLHTPGRVQFFLDLGAGVGRLVRIQSGVFYAYAGSPGAAFNLGVGLRGYLLPRLAMGIAVAAPIWTGVHPDTPAPPPLRGGGASELFTQLSMSGTISVTFGP
jgi:hypothetical protein